MQRSRRWCVRCWTFSLDCEGHLWSYARGLVNGRARMKCSSDAMLAAMVAHAFIMLWRLARRRCLGAWCCWSVGGGPYWAARPVRSVILSYSSRAVVLPSPPPSSSNKRGGEALVHGVVDPRVGVLIGYSTAGHPLAQFTRGCPPRSSPIQFRFPISTYLGPSRWVGRYIGRYS